MLQYLLYQHPFYISSRITWSAFTSGRCGWPGEISGLIGFHFGLNTETENTVGTSAGYIYLVFLRNRRRNITPDLSRRCCELWSLLRSDTACVMVVRFWTAEPLEMKALPAFESPGPDHLTTQCHFISLYCWTAAALCSLKYLSFYFFQISLDPHLPYSGLQRSTNYMDRGPRLSAWRLPNSSFRKLQVYLRWCVPLRRNHTHVQSKSSSAKYPYWYLNTW
jgi:hypothetical protein